MRDRIKALRKKGFTYLDITIEIGKQGGKYTGVEMYMRGKIGEPNRINLEQLTKAVEVLEAL